MNLDDLKNTKVALTHSGKFHADDVFGAAFLLMLNPQLQIKRVNYVPEDFSGLAFDIGMKEFDHHQYDNELRPSGVPYAAFGKLWKHFAHYVYSNYTCQKIDKLLIENLDLADNTGSYNSLAIAISAFNPITEISNGDEEFIQAVDFAKIILTRLIEKTQIQEQEMAIVKKYYDEAQDKKIIILDDHYYFQDYLPETEAIYVIYPSNRGGFCAQGVPKNSNTVELKRPFPSSWVQQLPHYLRFCHKSGFLIAADNLPDIIYACKEALK